MNQEQKDIITYKDESFYTSFDVINKDLDLLILLIVIEAFKKNKDKICFADFLKGDYWNIDNIREEIFDTNDYMSIEDMVFEQIIFLTEDQRLGNITGMSIDDPTNALVDLIFNTIKSNSIKNKDETGPLINAIEQITFLKNQNEEQKTKLIEENPDKITEIIKDRSVFIKKERNYISALQEILIQVPEHVNIHFIFDTKGINSFEKEISNYIAKFQNDDFQEDIPPYEEKRLYFSQQIENFFNYINKLNSINNVINIPFSILSEKGFEAVKILKYLELNNIIEFRWSDEISWKVKFNEIPINPNSLLGIKNQKKTESLTELKFNLSFIKHTGILILKNKNQEYKIKIQGQVQKEVLRVIFTNPENIYTEWSLYDISNILGPNDVDEIAVKNAIYQINRKVKIEIPQIDKLFLGNKHSVVLNEKYVSKN